MTLHAQLLAAHAAGDHPALVPLYMQAADTADTEDAKGFFLTQAYIFALETGAAEASILHARLKDLGRDS